MTFTEQIKQAATEVAVPKENKHWLCRHIFADGRRCGSSALRRETFCYYHTTNRPPVHNPRLRKQERNEFALSDPADRTALQVSLGEVLRLIAANQIDPRRAGLLLYGLQIASGNIPKPKTDEKRPAPVEELVDDPELGLLAPEKEVPPAEWNSMAWRRKDEREAILLEVNQKLVQECDERISELEKKHKKELSEQTGDLKYEANCLRALHDPLTKLWAERGLEEIRVRRENAAKHLTDSATEFPANSAVDSVINSDDELDTKGLDSEFDDEEDDDDLPIVPYINGSHSVSAPLKNTAYVPRLHPRIQQIVAQRTYSQPPRKPVTKSTPAECPTHDDSIAMSG